MTTTTPKISPTPPLAPPLTPPLMPPTRTDKNTPSGPQAISPEAEKQAVSAIMGVVRGLAEVWPATSADKALSEIIKATYQIALAAAKNDPPESAPAAETSPDVQRALRDARDRLNEVVAGFHKTRNASSAASHPPSAADIFEVFAGAYEMMLELDATINETTGHLHLHVPDSHRRKTTGSYYTPASLVEHLLDQTLQPMIDRAREHDDPAQSLRAIRVCDPACGTGRFLWRAATRLIDAITDGDTSGRDTVTREVIAHCIYGVDMNPLALSLCRDILALEAGVSACDIPELDLHLHHGNALLGTTPELVCVGIPRVAFQKQVGDDPEVCRRLRTRNRKAHKMNAGVDPDSIQQHHGDLWCAAFLIEKTFDTESAGQCVTQAELTGLLTSAGQTVRKQYHPFHWAIEFPEVFGSSSSGAGGFHAVVGNPPYLNQLETQTVHSRRVAALLRARFDGLSRSYTDTSSLFLALAGELTRPGGRFGLVLPQSILASRDASLLRQALVANSALRSLWVTDEYTFNASVFVCAPTFERTGARQCTMQLFHGPAFDLAHQHDIDQDALLHAETWSHLVAEAFGIPAVNLPTSRTISDLASTTADFRDEYYGLRGFVVESADAPADEHAFPRLITTGLIDLAVSHWGNRATRFNREPWQAPRVDLHRLEREGEIGPWARRRLVPKIMLATQTKIIELIVDEQGAWLPTTPIITIVPGNTDDLWHVAAALASPLVAAFALRYYGGVALTADTIKLSAKQVAQLPLPEPGEHWDHAADLFRTASHAEDPAERSRCLLECASAMGNAYGLTADHRERIFTWWAARYPRENQGDA